MRRLGTVEYTTVFLHSDWLYFLWHDIKSRMGPRKRRNIVSLVLPRLRTMETFVTKTFFAFEQGKIFLNFFRNILLPQQMFLAYKRGNIVAETFYVMFARFLGRLG